MTKSLFDFAHRPVHQAVGREGGEEDNLHFGVFCLMQVFVKLE